MKTKFGIIVFCMVCSMLTACKARINENSDTFIDDLPMENKNESGIDISRIEQIYIDEYEGQKDNTECVRQIIKNLGDNGYVAIDSDNKVDMTNADSMKRFIGAHESGEQAGIQVFRVSYSGGLDILEIASDEGKVSVCQTYYSFRENHLTETVKNGFEADYIEYTDEGYLLMEGYWPSMQKYVLSLCEEEEHIALRVDALEEKCRKLCEEYIASIGYCLNNVFITDWDEDNYNVLDFYDIFEKFYAETYGMNCPYTMNDDLSVGNEYEIPTDEFENVITAHFDISAEELRKHCRYDATKNAYIYRPRGFDEQDYAEVPYPEVVAYEENEDGSVTLSVNAVYPNDNTSKLFSHRVTVTDAGGQVCYLSNEIIGDENPDCWWHTDRLTDDEWNNNYKGSDEDDDYSWMIPQPDHVIFTDEEKKRIEADALMAATDVWELYEDVTMEDSQTSFDSGITDFTKEKRLEVLDALGSLGVIAATQDSNTLNGELLKSFYDDYINGIPGMITIYNVYEDGTIGSVTFLYRNDEIQSYYVGVIPGADGKPCIRGKSIREIAAINYTQKGYFVYEDKNPMLHASAFGYFRISPMSDECRSLTDKYLKYLEFQKYKLMVCDWNEDTVRELLMPGMFEDFYYIKYHEGYRYSFDSIPGDLFEEIMTTYLPVTVDDLRDAYDYDVVTGTYSQETVYNSPYPPFLEVTDYKYNSDGTITLYADGVWPDYNSDYAFTSVIVVKPFDDGTFRILSNDVTEQELKLPTGTYSN